MMKKNLFRLILLQFFTLFCCLNLSYGQTTYTVSNTSPTITTPNGLHWAIDQANNTPGVDIIEFSINGTIDMLTNTFIITEGVIIDGTTAPGYVAGTPSIILDKNGGVYINTSGSPIGIEINGLGFTNQNTNQNGSIALDLNSCTDLTVQNNVFTGIGSAMDIDLGGEVSILNNDFNTSGFSNNRYVVEISGLTGTDPATRLKFTGNEFTDGGSAIILSSMDGLAIDPTNLATTEVHLPTGTFDDVLRTALAMNNCDNITLDGLDLSNSTAVDGTGVLASQCDNLTLQNLTISNKRTGLQVSNGNDVLVQDNTISNVLVSGTANRGIYVTGGQDVEILDNIIQEYGRASNTYALTVNNVSDNGSGDRLIINGTTFIGGGNAVALSNMDALVIDNVLTGAPSQGVHLPDADGRQGMFGVNLHLSNIDNTTINNFNLSYTGGTVAGQGLTTNVCANLTISNNTVENRAIGIHCSNSDVLVVQNNTIDNVLVAGQGGRGIQISTGTNVQILDNTLREMGRASNNWALTIDNVSDNGSGQRLIVNGNTFDGGGNGAALSNMDALTIDNVLTGTPGQGVHLPDNDGRQGMFGVNMNLFNIDNTTINNFNLSYSGGTVAGSALSTSGCDNIDITNNTVDNRIQGIYCVNSANLLIENNEIDNVLLASNSGRGIWVQTGQNVEILDNTLREMGRGNNQYALTVNGVTDNGSGQRLVVNGITFVGGANGVSLENMDALTIDNVLTGAPGQGVHLPDADGRQGMFGVNMNLFNIDNTTINNFNLSYTGGTVAGSAINTNSCDNLNITNNTIHNRAQGIYCITSSALLVQGNGLDNILEGNAQRGIWVNGGNDVEILDNTIDGFGVGNNFYALDINNVVDNGSGQRIVVNGNTFIGGQDGVVLNNMNGLIIDNVLTGAPGQGVHLPDADGRQGMTGTNLYLQNIDDATLDNFDLSYTGGTVVGRGLFASNCDILTIQNFTINDRGSGMYFQNCTVADILSNTISGGNGNGIELFQGSDYLVQNNSVSDFTSGNNFAAYKYRNLVDDGMGNRLSALDNNFSNNINGIYVGSMDDLIISDGAVAGSEIILKTADNYGSDINGLRINACTNTHIENLSYKGDASAVTGTAIFYDNSTTSLTTGVSISYKGAGVSSLRNEGHVVQQSLFQSNAIGMSLGTANVTTNYTVANNNFICNTEAIRANQFAVVNAGNNFWGQNDGSSTDTGSGDTYTVTGNAPNTGVVNNSTTFLNSENTSIPIGGRKIFNSTTTQLTDDQTTTSVADSTDYETVNTGTTKTRQFRIVNSGTDSLFIASIISSDAAFTIANAPDFVLCEDSVAFDVIFAPTAAVNYTSTITINQDDCYGTDFEFDVAGVGFSTCDIAITSATPTDENCPDGNDGVINVVATCGSCANETTDIRYSLDNADFSNTTGDFTGLADDTYTVYVRDVNDPACNAELMNVVVGAGADTTPPTAVCQDVTVTLDANGMGSITAAQVNNGSSDNCTGTLTYSLSQTDFDCDDVDASLPNDYALETDGINDNIDMGNLGDALDNSNQATFQVWMQPLANLSDYQSYIESNGAQGFISLESGNGANNAKMAFWIGGASDGSVITQSDVITPNQWTNFTAVYDGTQSNNTDKIKIYVNGVEETISFTGTIPASIGTLPNFFLGSQGGTAQFANTQYDEVRIWDRALSSAEVAANWDQTIIGSEPGLVAYYAFEDGPGSSTVTEIVNGVPATLVAMDPNTAWVVGANGLNGNDTPGVEVILTVTDASNIAATCTANVVVIDNIDPVITCNADISTGATGPGGAVVNYSVPSVTEICGNEVIQTSGLPSGSEFPVGTTTNTFEVIDAAGNTAQCSFTVTVNCVISITSATPTDENCPGADDGQIDVVATCTSCTSIEYSIDDFATSNTTGDFSGLADGTYTVKVRDSGDNSCEAEMMNVVVGAGIDAMPPSITAPIDITIEVNNGCEADNVALGNATATDNCSSNSSISIVNSLYSLADNEFNGTFGELVGCDKRDLAIALSNYTYDNCAADCVTPSNCYFLNPEGNYAVVNQQSGMAGNQTAAMWTYPGHTTGTADDAYLAVNGNTVQETFYSQELNLNGGTEYEIGFWAATAQVVPVSGASDLEASVVLVSDNSIISSITTGDITSDVWANYSTTFTPATTGLYRFELKNLSVQAGFNDFSIDDITIKENANNLVIGANTVIWTATDEAGLTATDNQTVTVIASDINLQGNSTDIASGDTTPDTGDDTDFGTTDTATPVSKTFTIQNTGTATLSGITATLSGSSDFAISTAPNASMIAASGADLTFIVTYTPIDAGTDNGTVSIASNDCDEATYTFDITAAATIACDIAITSATSTDEGCPGADDGQIDVVATCTSCTSIEYSIDDFATSNTTGDFSGLADGTYTVKVRDSGDNSCEAEMMNVVVGAGADGTAPTISCNDITVDLDAAGSYTLTTADLEALAAGSTDGCSDFSELTISSTPSVFDCDDVAGQANNYALSFDETVPADFLESTSNVGITGNSARTLEFWIRMDETDVFNEHIINWGTSSQGNAFGFYQSFSSSLVFYTNNSPGGWDYNTGHQFDANQWYHIAATWDGTIARVFVDGVPAPNPTWTPPGAATQINTNDSHLFLAVREDEASTTHSTIDLDEVRIWDYARTEAEIFADKNLTVNSNEQGLVLYYDMEDGPGSTIATDKSISGNNGTLMQMDPATDWIQSGSPVFSGGVPIILEVTDAEGNTSTSSCAVSVTVNTNLTVSNTATGETCMGNDDGQIVATVTGGTGPYTFTATRQGDGSTVTLTGTSPQTFMNLIADDYIIEIEDNGGCTGTTTETVAESTTPCCDIAITSATPTDEVCPDADDGEIDVVATCTTCTSIEYSVDDFATMNTTGDFTGLADGTYTVKVRDAGDNTCAAELMNVVVGAGVDNTGPTIVAQDVTVSAVNGVGTITPSEVDNGSSDNCSTSGNITLSLTNDTFNCTDDANINCYEVSTLGGMALQSGDIDATGTAAAFNQPRGLAVDANGDIIFSDRRNHKIKKITATGVVTTIAGNGTFGFNNGTGSAAQFAFPDDILILANGDYLVTEFSSNSIRRVTPSGVVTTFAGIPGTVGSMDGDVSVATFSAARGIIEDSQGNFFVTDFNNHNIRKITSGGMVSTFAGTTGVEGDADGTGIAATFTRPSYIAIDDNDNLYVTSFGNATVRKITPTGVVTTIAGTSGTQGFADGVGSAALFQNVNGLQYFDGYLYITDQTNSAIRRMDIATNEVVTITGNPSQSGVTNGTSEATFSAIYDVAVVNHDLMYSVDLTGHTVRKIESIPGCFTTILSATDEAGNAAHKMSHITLEDCCDIAITALVPTAESCPDEDDGTVTVTATCATCGNGTADIEYSSDGTNWQSSNVLIGLADGAQTIMVRDANLTTCTDSDITTIVAGTNTTFYADTDNDGFGDPNNTIDACPSAPQGYVADNTDCDDTDEDEFPGQTWYIDADGDGYGGSSMVACERPADGFLLPELVANSTGTDDCDDADGNEFPGQTWYIDGDNDGYGGSMVAACERPADGKLMSELDPNSSGDDDCDDALASVNLGQTEVPNNGIDDNCNGGIDEVPTATWVALPNGTMTGLNGDCVSATDCCTQTFCFGLEYNPGSNGTLTSYTTGFTTDCNDGSNPIVTNASCVMTDNSGELVSCNNGGVLMNSSGINGSVAISVNTPVMIHQICVTVLDEETKTFMEDLVTDISMAIDLNTGAKITEYPEFDDLTVEGNKAPVLTEGTIDACYASNADAEAAAIAATVGTDDCPGAVVLTAETVGSCNAVVTVTGTDACGLTSTVTYSTKVDGTNPIASGSIIPTFIQGCTIAEAPDAETSVADLLALSTLLTISDDCTANADLLVTHTDDVSVGCPILITRTYYIEDECGNSTDFNHVIIINDAVAPAISGDIDDMTIDACGGASSAPAAVTTVMDLEAIDGNLLISDNCGADMDLTVSHVDDVSGTCPVIINRTYTIADACSNLSTVTQTLQVNPPDAIAEMGGPVETSATMQSVLYETPPPALPVIVDGCGQQLTPSPVVIGGTYQDGDCKGTITYTYTYEDCVGRTFDWVYTNEIDCGEINIRINLEGAYDATDMANELYDLHFLPGMDKQLAPFPVNAFGEQSPFGQPYQGAPWNYSGNLGANFGEPTSPGAPGLVVPYPDHVVDWVLVTVRENSINATGNVFTCAGWLHTNGDVTFPEACPNPLTIDGSNEYYIVVEHRNHLPVLDTAVIDGSNDYIDLDFTQGDSYAPVFRFGQKEIAPGVWGMYSSNVEQLTSRNSINSSDQTGWKLDQGKYGYKYGDVNLSGFSDSQDETLWKNNQNITSGIQF